MLILHGTGVSSGIAIGRAYVLHRERPQAPEYVLPEHLLDEEATRFENAITTAGAQLERIRTHIPPGAPPEISSILDTHLLILADRMIARAPLESIRSERMNAEWALKVQSEKLAAIFEKMDDPYLRNRKNDVSQVVDRVLRVLLAGDTGDDHDQISSEIEGQIVVATDLTPADTVLLKHFRVRAFITNLGGPISHTAILAKSLEIPAIVGAHNATRFLREGEDLIVDGKLGVVIAAPTPRIVAEYTERQRHIAHLRRELDVIKSLPGVTRDGQSIRLQTNIELPDDCEATAKVAADGVGLYRTEFLFLNRAGAPAEDEQYDAYVRVVHALRGKPVTIRTLDLGADKRAEAMGEKATTANPALGLRAVRLCLREPELFRPQLRAILRASAHGPVRLMIPMLSSLDETMQVLELIEETRAELAQVGIPFDPAMPVGGMIEVPAAAVAADLFAPHLDFFSIGTNDLIQYTLAIDRTDDAVSYLYDPLHPAVLRLIQLTIQAGNAAGIPVAMCGEMAGDPRYTRLLLGLGLREFSMHPASLLGIKRIVLESRMQDLERAALNALNARSALELREVVETMNSESHAILM